MMQLAVLTGDLIGSTRAGTVATEAALQVVAESVAGIGQWQDPACPPRLTRFRGDGWQCVTPLTLGPRAALCVLAALAAARGLQSRIALGLGSVTGWGAGPDLSAAHGPALTASGRALDAMGAGRILDLAAGDLVLDPRDLGLMRLWADLARGWTPEQAGALAMALHPARPRQTGIARALGITPQAVSQRLRGAGAEALIESLCLWEAAWNDQGTSERIRS